jgi:hypothetical protein
MDITVTVPPEFFRSVAKVLLRPYTNGAPVITRLAPEAGELGRLSVGDDAPGPLTTLLILFQDRIRVEHPDEQFLAQLHEELAEIVELFQD